MDINFFMVLLQSVQSSHNVGLNSSQILFLTSHNHDKSINKMFMKIRINP